MIRFHRGGAVFVAVVAMLWMATGVGAATEGDPLSNINCENVDVEDHGDEVSRWATGDGDAGEHTATERARENGRKTVKGVATQQGDDVSECANDTRNEEDDRFTIPERGQDGQDDHQRDVTDTATGHGDDVRETITFGDREANNVEINVTVSESDGSGDTIDHLPGTVNIAAGSNLTATTEHGDDVSDEAMRNSGREGRNPQTGEEIQIPAQGGNDTEAARHCDDESDCSNKTRNEENEVF